MARGPKKQWRQVLPHTENAFPWVRAALKAGYDVELKIADVTADEMPNFRRGLFNAAGHLGVSLHCHIAKQDDGQYCLTYAVHRKNSGRRHVLEKHGTERTAWPYNPRARTQPEGAE